jgi:hypothetical protein
MAHAPLKMTIAEAHAEMNYAWTNSYSPEALEKADRALAHKPLDQRINIFIARICFRGIYFPQMSRFAWLKLIIQNRRTIFRLIKEGFTARRSRPASAASATAASAITAERQRAYHRFRLLP